MTAYYNENNPHAAQWLRNLIDAGDLPAGIVDERSIRDVHSHDLRGFRQCHFFAGIGGWPLALRLAGWPDDRPVWTGSPPCQPFSVAGRRRGVADARHLWPAFYRLIRIRRPAIVFGEQVAQAVGHGWWDDVADGLETLDYACGAIVLPACAVGAPHRRDRLFFVADAKGQRWREGWTEWAARQRDRIHREHSPQGAMGNADGARLAVGTVEGRGDLYRNRADPGASSLGDRPMADADQPVGWVFDRQPARQQPQPDPVDGLHSYWSRGRWIACADGKARLAEPGIRLLVDGVSGRVAVRRPARSGDAAIQEIHWYSRIGAIAGFGNAIVPQAAAWFIAAVMEGLTA